MKTSPVKSQRVRINFEGIHPSVWEHPADRVALKTLQQVPGLDIALRTFFSGTTEKSLRLMALGSSVRASEKQFPRVYRLLHEACHTLDIEKVPEIFVSQNPFINAGAIGMNNPFINLNSALVDSMNDEELIGVIGHELAHIRSGHVLYKSLLLVMINISTFAMNIPLTMLAIQGIVAALREWDRKSELSADRAGLLVTQDPEKSIQLLMKMAGGTNLKQMDLGEFIKQAEEYEKADSIIDTAHKFMNTIWLSHPFPVIRAVELIRWVQSGEYDAIMRGYYNREGSDLKDDFRAAADSYTKDFKEVKDSILKNMRDSAGEAGKKAREFMDDMKKRQQQQQRNE